MNLPAELFYLFQPPDFVVANERVHAGAHVTQRYMHLTLDLNGAPLINVYTNWVDLILFADL